MADSTRALVRAAEDGDTKRLVIMSAFGVGESLSKASAILRFLYRGGKAIFADKAAGEQILTASALDWTLVYPVLLTNKPATNNVRAVEGSSWSRRPAVLATSR
ncbi:NAD(P)H-binding protein [Nonomuraea sp. G32]|nr:NAD(P)H-binding protein [Nonomuraea sp. G32]MDP4510202.1 NAD(P)H-binding protein [Nonomuraea sp. G32]